MKNGKLNKSRSQNMRAIRSKHTKPEITIRKILYAKGYRYKLHDKNLPGKPDLVFVKDKKVIFINGCFWHQHQAIECKVRNVPKSNTSYWGPKLARNVARDEKNNSAIKELGWKAITLWECEIRDKQRAYRKMFAFLGPANGGRMTSNIKLRNKKH
jgi:DNA mismatch endonuclease (patch repair protein)